MFQTAYIVFLHFETRSFSTLKSVTALKILHSTVGIKLICAEQNRYLWFKLIATKLWINRMTATQCGSALGVTMYYSNFRHSNRNQRRSTRWLLLVKSLPLHSREFRALALCISRSTMIGHQSSAQPTIKTVTIYHPAFWMFAEKVCRHLLPWMTFQSEELSRTHRFQNHLNFTTLLSWEMLHCSKVRNKLFVKQGWNWL